ncbi:MAG: transposase, partial [Burkholderiales bacterium]|nr:transposase [Burkholderiales bacterium]
MRTSVKINLGRKNFYVYSSVSSVTGYNFSLILPEVNTHNMNIYLQRLAKDIKNHQVLLIMDGASWHKSIELKIPKNLEIIRLPAYSPELNPAE